MVHDQHTKFVVFLYTRNEQSKNEIERTIPFTVTSKRIKYPGINLTKEVKDLYAKNYKKKPQKNPEPKAKIHKKKSHAHGLEDLILLRWQSY